jgi:hypothetical protein
LKLIGTNQLLVYADVSLLGGNVHTVKKNTQALVIESQETGLEMVMKLCTWPCLQIRMQDEVTI